MQNLDFVFHLLQQVTPVINMFSFSSVFSLVLVAAAIGVQAETHTVHFTNKCVLFLNIKRQ